jgi:hypothetical protein
MNEEPEGIDIDQIEACKENIQPLRQGRNAKTLLGLITSSESDGDQKKQRKVLESKIKNAVTSTDPLAPWLEYISWTQQNYLSATRKSYLIPLLEKCTRTFKSTEQYTNDPRYVDVWLQYAAACPAPDDIFAFMEANGIGSDLAKFYVAWAAYVESKSLISKAEEILQLGLAREAGPVILLVRAQNSLRDYVARRISAELNNPDRSESPEPEHRRTALHQRPSEPARNGMGAATIATQPRAGNKPRLPSTQSAKPVRAGNFQVFCDEAPKLSSKAATISTRGPTVRAFFMR